MNKLVIALVMIAAIAAALWYGTRDQAVKVRVVPVARGEVRTTVSNTRVGTVKACRRVKMSASAPGQVAVLNVTEGQRVASGEVLLEIWNLDRKAELRLARAEQTAARARGEQACAVATGARREADRVGKLRASKLISEEVADAAETEADSGRASCAAARAASDVAGARVVLAEELLERTVLRAPFSGVVAEVDAKLGEYLTPSPPGIATLPAIDLIDPSCVYISAPIDEVDAPRIETGMPACVTLDAFPDRFCNAEVHRIAPYVLDREKQARTVEVEVALRNVADSKRLLPGYSADIEIFIEGHDDVLRVPTEAVIAGKRVLAVDASGERLVETTFDPGLSNWQFTEVLGGLEEGRAIALSIGREGVEDGALVEPEVVAPAGGGPGE